MKSNVPFNELLSFPITTTRGVSVNAWPLIGKRVVYDHERKIYYARWEKDVKSTTPGQRRKRDWSPDEVRYIEIPRGIIEVERGLVQAIAKGVKSLPTLKEIDASLHQLNSDTLVTQKIGEPIREEFYHALEDIDNYLNKKTSKAAKEAREHLHYCFAFRDNANQIYIAILRCKTTAISDRIKERLETINAWTEKFNQDLIALIHLRRKFYRFLNKLNASLKRDLKEFNNFESMSEKQLNDLVNNIDLYTDHLLPWTYIEPFTRWSIFMFDDFGAVINRIRISRPDLINEIYQTMLGAIKLKLVQKEIFELIEFLTYKVKTKKVGDQIRISKKSFDQMAESFEKIMTKLEDEELGKTNFRDQVRQNAYQALEELLTKTDSNPFGRDDNGINPKVLENFKEGLKKIAYMF